MSVKNRDVEFSISVHHDPQRRTFPGIVELGFGESGAFVISAFTTPAPEPRGRYFTSLPISPAAYRRKHRIRTAFVRHNNRLTIWDDWGKPHFIEAPRDILDALAAECAQHEIADGRPPPRAESGGEGDGKP